MCSFFHILTSIVCRDPSRFSIYLITEVPIQQRITLIHVTLVSLLLPRDQGRMVQWVGCSGLVVYWLASFGCEARGIEASTRRKQEEASNNNDKKDRYERSDTQERNLKRIMAERKATR